jgi:hypothetical protein
MGPPGILALASLGITFWDMTFTRLASYYRSYRAALSMGGDREHVRG